MRLLRYIRKDKFNDIDFCTAIAATYCLSHGVWFGAAAWFAIGLVLNVGLAIVVKGSRGETP